MDLALLTLTDDVEEAARSLMTAVEDLGGAVAAIEKGFQKNEIEKSAYRVAQEIDKQERTVVGVNRFVLETEEPYEPSVGRATSLLANVPAAITLVRAMLARNYGDAERTTAFSQQALTQLGEADWLLGHFARYYLAMADWLRGRLVEPEGPDAPVPPGVNELPKPGTRVTAGQQLGEIESTKTTSALYTPVSGTIVKINGDLKDHPEVVEALERLKEPLVADEIDDAPVRQHHRRVVRRTHERHGRR